MKGLRFLLLVTAICLASGVKAQFYSSDQVYCYEYQYTTEDGIKSEGSVGRIVFVNFQNNMAGIVFTTKSEVASKGVSYFEKEARNKLAQNNRKFNSNPANMHEQADIIAYDSSNSSGSKYTYRRQTKYANMSYNGFGVSVYWQKAFWNGDCYTFTSDRNEYVEWYVSAPQNKVNFTFGGSPSDYTTLRRYYKLIDANKLKPNVEDLW